MDRYTSIGMTQQEFHDVVTKAHPFLLGSEKVVGKYQLEKIYYDKTRGILLYVQFLNNRLIDGSIYGEVMSRYKIPLQALIGIADADFHFTILNDQSLAYHVRLNSTSSRAKSLTIIDRIYAFFNPIPIWLYPYPSTLLEVEHNWNHPKESTQTIKEKLHDSCEKIQVIVNDFSS